MKRFLLVAAAPVLLLVGVAGMSTAQASSYHAGKPYGCQINPAQALCHTSATPVVLGVSVSTVKAPRYTPQVTYLPRTGGAASDSGSSSPLPVVAFVGFAMLMAAVLFSGVRATLSGK